MSSSTTPPVAENLFKWVKTFKMTGPHDSLSDLCDGVSLAQVCHQICPDHFNHEWLSKIKENVSSDNWRLRVSNIKKVVEGLTDYYESVILLGPLNISPDPLLIGKECDTVELGKLLQLILGAAVNCDHKEEYIESIMSLDTTTQLVVKNAIEELFQPFESTGRHRSSTDSMSLLADSLNVVHTTTTNLPPVEGTPAAFRLEIMMDEQNVVESKLKLQLEEEMRKNSHLKTQVDSLKKTVSELTTSVAQLTHRAEAAEFEVRLQKEKSDSLYDEKETMTKELNELKRQQRQNGRTNNDVININSQDDDVLTNLNREMVTKGHEVRIQELEEENARLRRQLSLQASAMMTNPSPIDIEGEGVDDKDTHNLQQELYESQQRIAELEMMLHKKEEEVAEWDNRYRKCVSKAKQVAKVLEPISMSSSNSSINSMGNVEQLALELSLKDKHIQELEAEHEKTKAFKEVEERLMSVAFHSLAAKLQRSSAEEQMTGRTTNGVQSPYGSFLSRQRQATSRRFNIPGMPQTNRSDFE